MPLLQGLAKRVLAEPGRGERATGRATMLRESFAHALSYLERAKPWTTEADNLHHRALFLEFSNAIARDLDATIGRVCRQSVVADNYPLLVPPVYDQAALLTHETIRALWFEAGDAVKHGRQLICMGYSLPESALTMKYFLRTTCGHRLEVVIVDPSPEAHRNFRHLFHTAGPRLRPFAAAHDTLARFVSEHLRP